MPWSKIDYSKCDLCGKFTKLCIRACPSHAYRLMRDRETKEFYITHNSRVCLGCRECASSCPKDAITVVITAFPDRCRELRVKSFNKMKESALQMLGIEV